MLVPRSAVLGCLFLVACGTSHPPKPDGSAAEDASTPASDAGPPDGALPSSCFEGTAVACGCPEGGAGYRYCEGDDVWGECECPFSVPDAGPPVGDAGPLPDGSLPDSSVPDAGHYCTGDEEWCDGLDNDCDGVVDNGEPCPDSSVSHTLPYEGDVWMIGDMESAGCNPSSIQRVWPDLAPEGARLGCRPYRTQFSTAGGDLYFQNGSGIVQHDASGDHTVIPTPPCFNRVLSYGFDAMDRIYYVCDGTIRREAGELMFTGDYQIVAVLGSGKLIAQKVEGVDSGGTRPLDGFFLVDTDGTELSRVDLSGWVGTSASLWGDVTVQGDAGFVAFRRTYRGSTRHEVVIFRVDGDTARWRKVRRVPVDSFSLFSALPLPDGTLIYRRSGSRGEWHRLMEFPPDAPPRVIRQSSDEPPLAFDVWGDLMAGPARDLP